MIKFDMIMFDFFKEDFKFWKFLFFGYFGLEKENICVIFDGKLVFMLYFVIFGLKEDNLYIKIDFLESQIEMIILVMDLIDFVYEWFENFYNIVLLCLENELFWLFSNLFILLVEEDILIVEYKMFDSLDRKYCEYLVKGYGKKI